MRPQKIADSSEPIEKLYNISDVDWVHTFLRTTDDDAQISDGTVSDIMGTLERHGKDRILDDVRDHRGKLPEQQAIQGIFTADLVNHGSLQMRQSVERELEDSRSKDEDPRSSEDGDGAVFYPTPAVKTSSLAAKWDQGHNKIFCLDHPRLVYRTRFRRIGKD